MRAQAGRPTMGARASPGVGITGRCVGSWSADGSGANCARAVVGVGSAMGASTGPEDRCIVTAANMRSASARRSACNDTGGPEWLSSQRSSSRGLERAWQWLSRERARAGRRARRTRCYAASPDAAARIEHGACQGRRCRARVAAGAVREHPPSTTAAWPQHVTLPPAPDPSACAAQTPRPRHAVVAPGHNSSTACAARVHAASLPSAAQRSPVRALPPATMAQRWMLMQAALPGRPQEGLVMQWSMQRQR